MGKKGGLRGHPCGWIAAFSWLVTGAILSTPASAGSFKINPVQINLPADRQAASLTIVNSDAAPASIRVVTHTWTQVNGVDVYGPTSNVIVSPPMFTVAAGKSQLVRVGLKNRNDASAYRVIFEEIPRQVPGSGQIEVSLRLNLPLYVIPKGTAKAAIGWRAWRDRDGEIVIEGRNGGNLHGQVLGLTLRDEVLSQQMGVVLPRSARIWKVGKRPQIPTGIPLMLRVRSPHGETQTQVVVEQR